MATLVLGVLGRTVLGPVGGIIGTLLGGAVDQRLFGAQRRNGRQASPELQAASYGEPIPVVRGRMRLSGNVIWAAPVRETAGRSGGKRGNATAGYSYSASFAVLLARGPIIGIGRVWADGKLLRDAAGQWLLPVTMRLLPGTERQVPDPLLAAAGGLASGFRGLAVAVFEDLPLAEFGNRLPNLAFEVIADEAPVDLGEAIAQLAAGAAVPLSLRGVFPAVSGLYLGQSGPLADAIAPAMLAAGAVFAAGETLVGPGQQSIAIQTTDAARARRVGADQPEDRRRRAAAANNPAAVELSYFDPARDYQPGLQRARLRGGARVEGLALPLVLTAAAAKQMGQSRLLRLSSARQRRTLHLPWRYLGLRPGDVLHLDGGDWQIREVRFAGFVLSLDLVMVPQGSAPLLAGDPGEALDHGDQIAGPTTLLALDLPPLPGELPDSPRFWLAGAGTSAGWRRAEVMISLDAGASWQPGGSLPGQTIMGTSRSRLSQALGAGWDRVNSVDVELISDAMWLESRPELSVLAGANLAMLGDELIQFAAVEAIGQRQFRLSGLLRGRRGTEWATARHQPAERFVLIDPAVMQPMPLPLEMLGQTVLLRAAGVGDADAAPITTAVGGVGMRPLVPVHLKAMRKNGEIFSSWIAQSRAGFGWPDAGFGGIDSAPGPAGELQTLFWVVLRNEAGLVAQSVVTEPAWRCPGPLGPLWLEVTQIGLVPGRTATIIIL